jgi:two-component system, chemotaxis family, response regulator Rcp1
MMNTSSSAPPFDLLLVEDNPEEIDVTTDLCSQAPVPVRLHVSQDGETLALLRQEAPYQNTPRPNLILLDLNLQIGDAMDLLAEIKRDKELQTIPVAVLGPQSEDAIDASFEHSADLYLTKPLDAQRLVMTVNWAQTCSRNAS